MNFIKKLQDRLNWNKDICPLCKHRISESEWTKIYMDLARGRLDELRDSYRR